MKNVNQHEQKMFLLQLQLEVAKINNVRSIKFVFTTSNQFFSIVFFEFWNVRINFDVKIDLNDDFDIN